MLGDLLFLFLFILTYQIFLNYQNKNFMFPFFFLNKNM